MADNDEPSRTWPAISVETADWVIQRIFAVSLTLASCAQMSDEPIAERLATASNDLDAIVVGLRNAAFEQVGRPTNPPTVASDNAATCALTDRLGVVARWADELSRSPSTDGAGLIQLLEATHSIYRAVVTLASQPLTAIPAYGPSPPAPTGQAPT
jgi:hypothetical protein